MHPSVCPLAVFNVRMSIRLFSRVLVAAVTAISHSIDRHSHWLCNMDALADIHLSFLCAFPTLADEAIALEVPMRSSWAQYLRFTPILTGLYWIPAAHIQLQLVLISLVVRPCCRESVIHLDWPTPLHATSGDEWTNGSNSSNSC